KRGELEITDLNKLYLADNNLDVQLLGRGFAWLDTGTAESLTDAADFMRTVQKRQGIKISVPEEIAYIQGWINKQTLSQAAEAYGKSDYGLYLKKVALGEIKY
ncbi:MAG: glucose-1-phosphate thymidylyltransferase, partial [Clostridiales bacterium]|nr:glucose-1-phosphate thymidylyltransferase [Clostridiales bacterium]